MVLLWVLTKLNIPLWLLVLQCSVVVLLAVALYSFRLLLCVLLPKVTPKLL